MKSFPAADLLADCQTGSPAAVRPLQTVVTDARLGKLLHGVSAAFVQAAGPVVIVAGSRVLEVHIEIQKVNWNWQASLACMDVELAVWPRFL